MVPVHAKHVAAGAFVIDKDDVGLSTDVWSLPDLQEWGAFAHGNDLSGSNDRWLPSDVQTQLLRSPALANAARLFRARWIKLKFRVTGDTYGIVRVYLLPDDVHRGTVDRSVGTLRRARRILLSSLDFSKTTWEGQSIQTNGNQKNGPHPLGYDISGADSSLLELFNNIPSPYPSPDDVVDVVSRDAMFNLLDGKVFGLTTELYAYQKKSAALMLQKEAQPGRVLDPRLQLVRGQDGESWYFDSVSGSLFLEPRHYDGISGGVLAEEMGSGKTIICLALILATRGTPANVPELYGTAPSPARKKVGSLLDMTASCITRNAVPWRPYLDAYGSQGWGYSQCISAIARNPGYYYIPAPELRRVGRHPSQANQRPPEKVYLSSATLVIVPNNLVAQWRQEIQKHTSGMDVIVITKKDEIPPHRSLIDCDIILFSQSRFEMLVTQTEDFSTVPLARLHFKRCIIDEGHKLGNSRIGKRSNLLIGLDQLRFDSRWVVTGTPSHGLFGVESRKSNENGALELPGGSVARESPGVDVYRSSSEMEKKDLERIGSMASLFLKARPWANTVLETGDTPADWDTYLMLPRHKKGSHGRWDSLKTTLDSLIIRHQLKEIGSLLPPVNERVVVLEGSYQDRLSMNIFSMMIIFNSVQSQRTDMDYFFHPRQRRSLLQIVHNLKQSTFFGGSFFAASEIAKSVETAEEFLKTKSVPINEEDEALLRQAIDLGHTAVGNSMRNISNQFHEMPVWVENFPGGAGHAWSLGDAKESKGPICTSASLLLALQRLVYNTAGEPEKFNALLNGGFVVEGKLEQEKLLNDQSAQASSAPRAAQSQTLAGNTKLGGDSPHKSRSHGVNGAKPVERIGADAFPEALDETTITATVSAKMSYMLDQIVKYQDDEKIIVFYENENIAWYLASMLDVVSCDCGAGCEARSELTMRSYKSST